MYRNSNNIFAILLLVFTVNTTCEEDSTIEYLSYNKLLNCLNSLDVNITNVHSRTSEMYETLNRQWNTLNDHVQPLAYFLVSDVTDIQNAVKCCRSSNVRIVARSGGHSFIKTGFGDSQSLIVDLTKLNRIVIHPERMTCEIGAGARLGRISYTLWKNGKFIIPSGVCPTVGIAGLALGGGYGRFTKIYGLTSDNVIEMEMVDAKGRLLLINDQTNRDLFWALRGGGGGNFGIVTKFKFQMYSAPRSVIHGVYEFRFFDFSQFYGAWQSLFTSEMPNHVSVDLLTVGHRTIMEIFALNGHGQNETTNSIANFMDSFPFPKSNFSLVRDISYDDLMLRDGSLFTDGQLTKLSQLNTVSEYSRKKMKVKAMFIDKTLNKNQIRQLNEMFKDNLQHFYLFVQSTGGVAVDTFFPSDTAFVHRRNYFLIQMSVITRNEQPNLDAERALNDVFERSKLIFDHSESYQNYMDQDLGDYLQRYYGSNLNRLIAIKRRYDPDNVFHHPQSIPVR